MWAWAAHHCGLSLPDDRFSSRLYWVWLVKQLDLPQLFYYSSIDRCDGTSGATYVSVVFSDSCLLRFSDLLGGIFESWVVFCFEGRTALNSAGGRDSLLYSSNDGMCHAASSCEILVINILKATKDEKG
jgi:hypothetical protein